VDALDQLVRGGFRLDAAYVAERVLKRDELLACVDARWPEPEKKTEPAAGSAGAEVPDDAEWLRWVLARRLAREGRYDLARKYYPEDQRARFSEFTKVLSEGRDRQKPAATRADALWKAARMARYRGLDLFGTEDEPDWAWAGGSFQLDPASKVRSLPTGAADRSAKAAAVSSERSPDAFKEALEAKVNLSSPDERQRLQSHGVRPEKRFHYRYFAADLAWDAAALMPDGSGTTAQVLCEAGTWLKDRDPKEADRFYKALVRRCRTTALGSEAETTRWFPKIDPVKP